MQLFWKGQEAACCFLTNPDEGEMMKKMLLCALTVGLTSFSQRKTLAISPCARNQGVLASAQACIPRKFCRGLALSC